MKYKNVSTKGSHSITKNGKRVIEAGTAKSFKINGEHIPVLPGEIIDSPVTINDPEMEMIEEEIKEEKIEKTSEEDEKFVTKEVLSEEQLKALTKDGLNDYGAKIGLDEINSSMKKDEMIAAILDYQTSDELEVEETEESEDEDN